MRSSQSGGAVGRLAGGLDALAGMDVAGLDDQTLREQLLDLVSCANRMQQVARLAARVGVPPVAEVEPTLADAARTLDPGG